MCHIQEMVDRSSRPRRPRDVNERAKLIVDIAVGDGDSDLTESDKNAHAVALGRLGGLKGGRARAQRLSPERRREIAKKAAEARWRKDA